MYIFWWICVKKYEFILIFGSFHLNDVVLQEQQQLLSVYQDLVVKQLVSQSQSRKQEEVDQSGEPNEEARSVRNELVVLTPQVKDLVLAQRKTASIED